MEGADFEGLLAQFPATVIWQQSLPCACVQSDGLADQACGVCQGKSFYFADPSESFDVCLIDQNAKERAAMAQTMGPGEMGDARLVIFEGAPCYEEIAAGDRIWDCVREEHRRIQILPNVTLTLPPLYHSLAAMVRADDGQSLIPVAPPQPDPFRRVSVSRAMRLDYWAPRGYQVVPSLAKIRTFGQGLPKTLQIKMIDFSAR
jgi:hypothetical protein